VRGLIGNTDAWSIGTTQLVKNTGGHFGFGTATPDHIITVQSPTRRDGIMLKDRDENRVAELTGNKVGNDSGRLILYEGDVPYVELHATGKSFFLGGRVGILTDEPKSSFEVHGSVATTIPAGMTTAEYALGEDVTTLTFNYAGEGTLDMPYAGFFPGRIVHFVSWQPYPLNSGISNIGLLNGGITRNILPPLVGAWCTLQSNGVYWEKLRQGNRGAAPPFGMTTATHVIEPEQDTIIYANMAAGTVTMPDAVDWPGRKINFSTWYAYTLDADASVIVPINGGLGTAILPATVGAWALVQSDGTYWYTIARG
jgi:hypothetical protein